MKEEKIIESIKCKITNISNIQLFDECLSNWTYAYHKVFSDQSKYGKSFIKSKEYQKEICKHFNLNVLELMHLNIQVNERIEQCKTNLEKLKNKQKKLQEDITKDYSLEEISVEPNSTKTINYYKKINNIDKQIQYFEKNPYGIVFGGKENLRKISYLSNLLKLKSKDDWYNFGIKELRRNQPNRILNDKDINNKILSLKNELKKLPLIKEAYKKQRIIPYYAVGDSGTNSGKHCNKFFEFNLVENYIIFKPNKNTKIRIDFTSNDKDLFILDEANKNKQLPITVVLNKDSIIFSYETFKLHHNLSKFNKKNAKESGNIVKDEINSIYKKRNNKYYASVDINPQEIGLSVVKKIGNSNFKTIKSYNFSLKNIKLIKGVKSTDKRYKKTANILKNEQGLICKKIIEILNYYNVRYFIMDNLEGKGSSTRNKTINRLFTQIWHKNRIKFLLNKRCKMYGIEFIDNVWNGYTSIIGNINYPLL